MAQGSDRLYGTTADVFQVVRCSGCGMMRLSPRPDAAHCCTATIRRSTGSIRTKAAPRVGRSGIAGLCCAIILGSFCARSPGSSGRLLDVGCGGGLLPGMLRERGVQAMGLDSSPAACRIAWTRHGVPAVTGDLISSPFEPESFAVITLFHVLEHLPAPGAFLSAAHGLLRPGGRMVIQVPNADSWQFRMLGRRWNGLDIPRHLNHFRPADLKWLLEECGFEVLRVKHFSLRDNPAGLATSVAPGLDPMARRVRGKRSGLLDLAAHFALVAAALPFALLEAAFGHGASIMIEARKR